MKGLRRGLFDGEEFDVGCVKAHAVVLLRTPTDWRSTKREDPAVVRSLLLSFIVCTKGGITKPFKNEGRTHPPVLKGCGCRLDEVGEKAMNGGN